MGALVTALPPHGPLTPGAHDLEKPLAGSGLARVRDYILGRGDAPVYPGYQLAPAVVLSAWGDGYVGGLHSIRAS